MMMSLKDERIKAKVQNYLKKTKPNQKVENSESSAPAVTTSNGAVSIDKIEIEESVRNRIDPQSRAFQNLKESVRLTGIANPVLVEKHGDKYSLLSGARRLAVCRKLGINDIPVRVLEPSSPEDGFAKQLVSDFAREDLHPLDAARLFLKYLQARHKGMSVDEVIRLFNDRNREKLPEDLSATVAALISLTGQSPSTIRNQLRLLKLPESVQWAIQNGEIRASYGYVLAEHPDREDLNELVEKVAKKQMTRSELKEIFRKDDGLENFSRKRYSRMIKNIRSSIEKDAGRINREDRESLVAGLKELLAYISDAKGDVPDEPNQIEN